MRARWEQGGSKVETRWERDVFEARRVEPDLGKLKDSDVNEHSSKRGGEPELSGNGIDASSSKQRIDSFEEKCSMVVLVFQ